MMSGLVGQLVRRRQLKGYELLTETEEASVVCDNGQVDAPQTGTPGMKHLLRHPHTYNARRRSCFCCESDGIL